MAVTLDELLDYSVLEDMEADEIVVPEGLTLEAARKGKREALEMLEHYGVFEARPMDELGGIKCLRARLGTSTARRRDKMEICGSRVQVDGGARRLLRRGFNGDDFEDR